MKKSLLYGLVIAALALIGTEAWLLAKPTVRPASHLNVPSKDTKWRTYHNAQFGFSIEYPDDGTYTVTVDIADGRLPRSTRHGVEPAPVNGSLVSIGQAISLFTADTIINRETFVIYVTPDARILTSMPVSLEVSSVENINDRAFKKLTVAPDVVAAHPALQDYAYAVQHNGYYYVFQANHGPSNALFEHMIRSVTFD